MKEMIRKGEISILLPEEDCGGLTGEVHLVTYDDKKFVIRRCKKLATARYYEELSKKFEKYGFLPKFLGRYGKDVAYEFIKGRDLRDSERLSVFEEIGKIAGMINSVKSNKNADLEFYNNLNELVSGNYRFTEKVATRRARNKITKKPKKVLKNKKADEIKKVYLKIKKIVKPKITLDAGDFIPGNFRMRKGKVYLVDIECIRPLIKGQGISKFLRFWGDTPQRERAFMNGYSKYIKPEIKKEEYKDLIDLRFNVQALWFRTQVARKFKENLKAIEKILSKYR